MLNNKSMFEVQSLMGKRSIVGGSRGWKLLNTEVSTRAGKESESLMALVGLSALQIKLKNNAVNGRSRYSLFVRAQHVTHVGFFLTPDQNIHLHCVHTYKVLKIGDTTCGQSTYLGTYGCFDLN